MSLDDSSVIFSKVLCVVRRNGKTVAFVFRTSDLTFYLAGSGKIVLQLLVDEAECPGDLTNIASRRLSAKRNVASNLL